MDCAALPAPILVDKKVRHEGPQNKAPEGAAPMRVLFQTRYQNKSPNGKQRP